MTEIDQIQINLGAGTLFILNLCLAFLTFGVALDIDIKDFGKLLRQPKKVIVGLGSQWILMPIWTLFLIYVFQPAPTIALGMALVASCPGGNVSNYATHLARGNTALSVTMTSFVTLAALIMTPVVFSASAMLVPGAGTLLTRISLDPWAVMWTIIQLIVLPLLAGLYLAHRQAWLADKIRKPVKVLSMVIFLSIIIGAVLANTDNILKYIHVVFLIVLLHNGLAYAIGYFFARTNRLEERDARAISIETGIQNSGLGLILIFNFFEGFGGMMLVAAFWGVWDLISVFLLALWWSKKPLPAEVKI